jgi:DNA invertase Pin-like site-specific DNA recombinase
VKAVAYLRVSTDKQAEEGLGLEVQEAALRRWAKAHGHRIVALARDEGVSGMKDAASRPGLAEALSLIEDGKADALVVARLDRLARSLTVQEAVLAHVWKHGGRVFSVDSGEVLQDDPDDPMRTFIRQVMGAAAQLERATIVSRMRAGRRLKAEGGGYAGYGSPPYGFRAVDGRLVPVEEEQRALHRIGELRSQGASLRAIASALTAEGYRPKRGGEWHSRCLSRIVARMAA